MNSNHGTIGEYDPSIKYYIQDVTFMLFNDRKLEVTRDKKYMQQLYYHDNGTLKYFNRNSTSIEPEVASYIKRVSQPVYKSGKDKPADSKDEIIGYEHKYYIKNNRYIADIVRYDYESFVNHSRRCKLFDSLASSALAPKRLRDYCDVKAYNVRCDFLANYFYNSTILRRNLVTLYEDESMELAKAYVDSYNEYEDMFHVAVDKINNPDPEAVDKEQDCLSFVKNSIYNSNLLDEAGNHLESIDKVASVPNTIRNNVHSK